jgi:hypothetical protein
MSQTAKTQLDQLLETGKATKPYIRAIFYQDNRARGGKAGYRATIVQQSPAKASAPSQNSLLRVALGINAWVTNTAIITLNEKVIREKFPNWDGKNIFFVSQNLNGSSVDSNIEGDYTVVDKALSADEFFGVENDETTIVVIESFTPNPYRVNMAPVLNPVSRQPVKVLTPEGNSAPYYRHTEIRLVSELHGLENQSIQQYVEKVKNGDKAHILLPSQVVQMASNDASLEVLTSLMEDPYTVPSVLTNSVNAAKLEEAEITLLTGIK